MGDQERGTVWSRATTMSGRVRLVIAVVLVALVAVIGINRWRLAPGPEGEPAAKSEETSEPTTANVVTVDRETQERIGLTVVTVQPVTLQQRIRVTGTVGPNETRMAHIRPPGRGVIQKVFVRPGDRVKAGQPLLQFDNIELGDAVAEYRTTRAALQSAQAAADVATRSLERAQKLAGLGAMAPSEHERRRADEAAARATVNEQEAAVANAERKLVRFGVDPATVSLGPDRAVSGPSLGLLRAPFAGSIVTAQAAEGGTATPDADLFTLADLSTVWIQANVAERDIASLEEGQEVQIHVDAYPEDTFIGRLTSVSDLLDADTRTARVRCEVVNREGRLKMQMFATIDIPTMRPAEALLVPAAAVQQLDNRSVVFVRSADTTFQSRAVTLGRTSGDHVEVTAGLNPGDLVVVQGAVMLKSKLKIGEIGERE